MNLNNPCIHTSNIRNHLETLSASVGVNNAPSFAEKTKVRKWLRRAHLSMPAQHARRGWRFFKCSRTRHAHIIHGECDVKKVYRRCGEDPERTQVPPLVARARAVAVAVAERARFAFCFGRLWTRSLQQTAALGARHPASQEWKCAGRCVVARCGTTDCALQPPDSLR